jgi:hypothetical protein
MDAKRRAILDNAIRVRDGMQSIIDDCAHWNRIHPDQEPIDGDPDGRMQRTIAAINEMLAIDERKGHTGKIDAPSMDILYPKGPKGTQ